MDLVMGTLLDALDDAFVSGLIAELVDILFGWFLWLVERFIEMLDGGLVDLSNDGLTVSLPCGKSVMATRIVVNHSIDVFQ